MKEQMEYMEEHEARERSGMRRAADNANNPGVRHPALPAIAHSTKLTVLFSAITAICSLVMAGILLMTYIRLVPKLEQTMDDVHEMMPQMEELAEQTSATMEAASRLIEQNEVAAAEALEKLNGVDLDSLNRSIKSLGDVIEPLSKFFNLAGEAGGRLGIFGGGNTETEESTGSSGNTGTGSSGTGTSGNTGTGTSGTGTSGTGTNGTGTSGTSSR